MKNRTPRKQKKAFKNVQPLILVYYMDVGNLPDADVNLYMKKIAKGLFKKNEDGIIKYLIPVRNQETKVECINPIKVDGKLYAEVLVRFEELKNKFDELLNKNN